MSVLRFDESVSGPTGDVPGALAGEPPLGGKSLGPLIEEAAAVRGISNKSLAGDAAGDVAFSQYGRNRCLENAFYTAKDAKNAKVPCTPVQYMG